jgi:hypothetical protein
VQSWYLDIGMIRRYWSGERLYHHTAPVNAFYGLREALSLVVEEGLDARIARHARNAAGLHAGLESMGLGLFAEAGCRLPSLTTVRVPEGCDEAAVRGALLSEFDLEIGGGLGPVKGKVWRVGLMGETSVRAASRPCCLAVSACTRRPDSSHIQPSPSSVSTARQPLWLPISSIWSTAKSGTLARSPRKVSFPSASLEGQNETTVRVSSICATAVPASTQQ